MRVCLPFGWGFSSTWRPIPKWTSHRSGRSCAAALLCRRAMIEWYWKERGIRVVQGWGMTETNPIASIATLKPHMEEWDLDDQLDRLETAGLVVPGLQVKIVDELGEELPHDGEAFGELVDSGGRG